MRYAIVLEKAENNYSAPNRKVSSSILNSQPNEINWRG